MSDDLFVAAAAPVTDDATLPIALSFEPDQRVHRYTCHVGYRTDDGQLHVTAHAAGGPAGLVVDERMHWGPGQARPDHVSVDYSILWADPEWEPVEVCTTLPTDDPVVTMAVSPGDRIAELTIASDLTSTELGALATIFWVTDLPEVDGRVPRNYSGGFVISGAGAAGEPDRRSVSFPYRPGTEASARFSWTTDLALPSGRLLTGSGEFTLLERADVTITAADLRPG